MNFFIRYILPSIFLVFFSVNWLFEEPIHNSINDQIIHARETKDYNTLKNLFDDVQNDTLYSLDDHYEFLNLFFEMYKYAQVYPEQFLQLVQMYYTQLSFSEERRVRDLANFSLGLIQYRLTDYGLCLQYWTKIENGNLKRLNNYYGMFYFNSRADYAEWYFKQELNSKGAKDLAYSNLGNLYFKTEQYEKLDSLLQIEESRDYISGKIQREYFIKNNKWKDYNKSVFQRIQMSFDILGFLGALLIIIIWSIYLRKIDFTSYRKPLLRYAIIFSLGMIMAYFTSYLTDYNKYIIGFDWNGELLHDFMYCVIGIGVVEELVKFIPVLLLFTFTDWFEEPVDFIVFASMSALGFSFIENNLYFGNNGLSIIQGRALTATVSHMFDSSIVAYGMVLAIYTKKNTFLYVLSFFLLASLTHGFYDFWLIKFPNNRMFQLITLVFLLVSMFVWTSMINNCLNNSGKFSMSKTYNQKKVFVVLLIGLTTIYLFEFIALAGRYGPIYANKELIKDLMSGVFLLLFLTFSLSKLDIIKNYWAPITLWDWQTIRNLPSIKPVFFNLDEIIGTKVRIESFRDSSVLHNYLPISGVIISRELLSWEKDWYLVKLDNPINVGWKIQNYVLIKVKYQEEIMLSNDVQIIHLRLVNNIEELDKKVTKKKDFLFIDFAKLHRVR